VANFYGGRIFLIMNLPGWSHLWNFRALIFYENADMIRNSLATSVSFSSSKYIQGNRYFMNLLLIDLSKALNIIP